MTKTKYLSATARACPKCKSLLEFESFYGMNKVHEVDGQRVIQARCTSKDCGLYWGVKAND